MKKLLIIGCAILMVSNSIIFYLYTTLKSESAISMVRLNENESQIQTLNLERKDLEAKVDELKESINAHYVPKDKYVLLQESTEDLNFAITELEENNLELLDRLSTLNELNSNLEKSLVMNTGMLLRNGRYIKLGESEEIIVDSFGKPIEEEYYRISDGPFSADTIFKKSIYNEFSINYIGSKSAEEYYVDSITASSSNLSTVQGIKVGDSIRKLYEVYPTIKIDKDNDKDIKEIEMDIFGDPVSDCIRFTFKEEIIDEILIYTFVP